MKKQSDFNFPFQLNNEIHYYHLFCSLFVGKHLNITKVTRFRLQKVPRSTFDKQDCAYCANDKSQLKTKGTCLKCMTCQKTLAHPLCLWLKGCEVTLTRRNVSSVKDNSLFRQCQGLADSMQTDRVRQMFVRKGAPTNGGYTDDPAYLQKTACSLDLEVSAQLLTIPEVVSEESSQKSYEVQEDNAGGPPEETYTQFLSSSENSDDNTF